MKQLTEAGTATTPGSTGPFKPHGDHGRSITADTSFDRTTSLRPRSGRPGTFDVDLDHGWSSLVGIHGGYLAAIATRAGMATVSDRAVRTITTSFLRPARPGPAELTVATVRHGRSVTVALVELRQGGRTITSTRLTLVADHQGEDWSTSPPLAVPAPSRCVPIEPPRDFAHFNQATALLDPAHLPFTGNERALVQGHVRPLEPRPIDAPWLAMIVDWFPPAAFARVDPPIGGISIDLTTHIHRTLTDRTADGWLAASFESATSVDGLALEHGTVADADGSPLTESFHTRWTA